MRFLFIIALIGVAIIQYGQSYHWMSTLEGMIDHVSVYSLPKNNWIRILSEKPKCEGELQDGMLKATQEGERNCLKICKKKRRALLKNVPQMFRQVLIKCNNAMDFKFSENDIKIEIRLNNKRKHECVVNGGDNTQLECQCQLKFKLYGSDEAQSVIDKAIRLVDRRKDKRRRKGPQTVRSWDLNGGGGGHRSIISTRQYPYSYNPAYKLFSGFLATVLLVVGIIVLHIPPLWIFIPLLFWLWKAL